MLVSHPTFWIDADLADLRELASMDVHLEHCACMLIDCPSRQFTAEELHDWSRFFWILCAGQVLWHQVCSKPCA